MAAFRSAMDASTTAPTFGLAGAIVGDPDGLDVVDAGAVCALASGV
jgi:hypothetical protein